MGALTLLGDEAVASPRGRPEKAILQEVHQLEAMLPSAS